ncbi:hypothetical protein [Blautia obeum]|uniref:DUF1617 family protein n=1 Tax=Blautia obeum TaxID=40520 RepID=A0A415HV80_9FIRM|nr:hypothetical protein [Blautia obeum]RHK98151.1 hypothetical protein DW040_02255 [Blautia obeum]
MNKTIHKTMSIADIKMVLDYYKKERSDEKTKDKFNIFSLSTQWNIKRDIDIMTAQISDFIAFTEEKVIALKDEYVMNDEKGQQITVKQMVDGKEKEVPARQVKPEYMDEFTTKYQEIQMALLELAKEQKEFDIYVIDFDAEVSNLKDDTSLTMDDVEFLSVFA